MGRAYCEWFSTAAYSRNGESFSVCYGEQVSEDGDREIVVYHATLEDGSKVDAIVIDPDVYEDMLDTCIRERAEIDQRVANTAAYEKRGGLYE